MQNKAKSWTELAAQSSGTSARCEPERTEWNPTDNESEKQTSVTIQMGGQPAYTSTETYDYRGTGLLSTVTAFSRRV